MFPTAPSKTQKQSEILQREWNNTHALKSHCILHIW